jgi:phage tail P2-like protein
MSDVKSLLPMNADQGLRDFEQATARLGALPVDINKLWSPSDCPEHLLGWFAWALSVEVWDTNWPEATKREVIRKAVGVHRIKGTRRSVEAALEAIGFEADIREWFEVDGVEVSRAPRTFEITSIFPEAANLGGEGLARSVAHAKRMIDVTKPASAHYSFHIGQKITGATRLGASGFGRMADTRTPRVEANAQATRHPSAALIGHIRNTASIVAMRMTRGPVVAVFGKLEVV